MKAQGKDLRILEEDNSMIPVVSVDVGVTEPTEITIRIAGPIQEQVETLRSLVRALPTRTVEIDRTGVGFAFGALYDASQS